MCLARHRRQRSLLPCALLAACALLTPAAVHARRGARVAHVSGLPLARIPAGSYDPLYSAGKPGRSPVRVPAFMLMTRPVTNADFLAFTRTRPEFRRDRIARVFADESYLGHWAGPAELGAARSEQPVTNVSWFAAKAFCESRGLRLPSEAEWERAAAASETRRNGRAEPGFVARLLAWYATPKRELPDVPAGPANVYGVHDLHGVVWEWVLDFNDALVVADSREQGDDARDRFCGGGALSARDTADYAAFMRVAMRSSLQAHYTTANLGFRCAADASAAEDAP